MYKIKCVIIDDEPLAIALLESYVKKTPFLALTATLESAIEASQSSLLDEAELLFLDIHMPTLNGLEFSRMIKPKSKIIFTTAFVEYALESYKVNALDYLVKPVSYNDFLTATQKALAWFELQEKANFAKKKEENTEAKNTASIFVKSDYKLFRINFDDLIYVEGLKDYVKFYLEGTAKPVTSLMNLKKVEELLPKSDFIRIHRSFIVKKDKIKMVERSHVVFGKTSIPVGDAYKEEWNDFLSSLQI